MARRIVLSTLLLIGLVLLQTTVLRHISIRGVTPDLSMLVLVFFAHRNGAMAGQVSGFATGIVADFLSLSPLGFHAAVKTVLGFLFGNTAGRVFADAILLPVLFGLAATIIKVITAGIFSFVFGIAMNSGGLFSLGFLIELGLNAILSPPLFWLTKKLIFLQPERREVR